MKRGVVIGKFYPPHRGHQFLIETALAQSDQLAIIVCERRKEWIAGSRRKEWLESLYPQAKLYLLNWDGLPARNSPLWAKLTVEKLGYQPELVFTSEEYGPGYSRIMGAEHISVDDSRKKYPVSGTAVRKNPWANWQFLPLPVKRFFAIRVVVLGAESTGTTTLSRSLAKRYQTCWVPEYGRLHYEGKMFSTNRDSWLTEEFAFIAKEQTRIENELAGYCNQLLVCDTDAFATTLWHERYMGEKSPEVIEIAKNSPDHDFYVLTDTDIPFVQDGTRDGEHIRKWMHQRFIDELERWGKKYLVVSGDAQHRLSKAVKAVEKVRQEVEVAGGRFRSKKK